MCGLLHSTRVTVPLTFTGLSRSYSAIAEWCASTVTVSNMNTANAIALVLIGSPGFSLRGGANFSHFAWGPPPPLATTPSYGGPAVALAKAGTPGGVDPSSTRVAPWRLVIDSLTARPAHPAPPALLDHRLPLRAHTLRVGNV